MKQLDLQKQFLWARVDELKVQMIPLEVNLISEPEIHCNYSTTIIVLRNQRTLGQGYLSLRTKEPRHQFLKKGCRYQTLGRKVNIH
jgi:hypothetical protein